LGAIRERDDERAERIAVEHVRQVRKIRIALALENERAHAHAGANHSMD
jgi:hypothetical protein